MQQCAPLPLVRACFGCIASGVVTTTSARLACLPPTPPTHRCRNVIDATHKRLAGTAAEGAVSQADLIALAGAYAVRVTEGPRIEVRGRGGGAWQGWGCVAAWLAHCMNRCSGRARVRADEGQPLPPLLRPLLVRPAGWAGSCNPDTCMPAVPYVAPLAAPLPRSSVCTWLQVPVGRRDAAGADPDGRMPAQDASAEQLVANFAAKGLSAEELVVLSGSHTVRRRTAAAHEGQGCAAPEALPACSCTCAPPLTLLRANSRAAFPPLCAPCSWAARATETPSPLKTRTSRPCWRSRGGTRATRWRSTRVGPAGVCLGRGCRRQRLLVGGAWRQARVSMLG